MIPVPTLTNNPILLGHNILYAASTSDSKRVCFVILILSSSLSSFSLLSKSEIPAIPKPNADTSE